MAIAFRASGKGSYAARTSLSVAKPTGTVSGDVMVLGIYIEPKTIVPSSAGWSQIAKVENAGANYAWVIFAKKNEGEAGPYEFGWGGTSQSCTYSIGSWSGGAGVPTVAAGESGNSTAPKAPSITTLSANSFVVFMAASQGQVFSAQPAGFTSRVMEESWDIGDKEQAIAGATGTATATMATGPWTTVQVSLEPEATTPVVTKPSDKAYSKSVAITPFTLVATNTPTEFKQSGLPAGLALNGATGEITGTPTAVEGVSTVEVWAKNGSGEGAHVSFKVEITAKPKLTKPANQTSETGKAITPFTPTVEGANLTWSAAVKPLPGGITINSSTGQITGTPTTVEAAHLVQVKVDSANGGSDTVNFEWTVNAGAGEGAPTITKPATQTSTVNVAIATLKVSVTNTASASSVNLPTGLTLTRISNTELQVTGTPTVLGTKTTEIKVKNAEGAETSTTFEWKIIEAAATINKPANQTTTQGNVVNLSVTGTNIDKLTTKELPAGLSLKKVSETEWKIEGTPTTVKSATTVTLEAKNEESVGENKTFTWTIESPSLAEPVGTYKFRPTSSTTSARKLYTTSDNGVQVSISISPSLAFGTNDENEAWIAGVLFSTWLEPW